MIRYPMTVRGAARLTEELRRRKSEDRPRIIAAVEEARSHGDLRENAEYHAAREQHGFNEGRIQELETKLGNSQVIDVLKLPKSERAVFGTTVEAVNLDTDEKVRYQIVGEDEADVKEGRISHNSPTAKAFLGKETGDTVTVHLPGGKREYEIEAVHYI